MAPAGEGVLVWVRKLRLGLAFSPTSVRLVKTPSVFGDAGQGIRGC
jgi:hypothetical protein